MIVYKKLNWEKRKENEAEFAKRQPMKTKFYILDSELVIYRMWDMDTVHWICTTSSKVESLLMKSSLIAARPPRSCYETSGHRSIVVS